jgi:putative nucleotidyltransferase with HDIG domain
MPPERVRVLVVDDDPALTGIVSDILQGMGHEVVACNDPREAMGRAQGVSVAVVDLSMPGMTGLELADQLRLGDPHIQVVVLTGQADVATAVAGLQRGVFDYIEKQSLDAARLRRSVREAAERSRLSRENTDLLRRVKESNKLLTALHDVSTLLATQPHLDRVLPRLCEAARDLCGVALARVMLFEPTSSDGYVVAAAAGDGAGSILGARLKHGEGIAPLVMERDESLLLTHPKDNARYSHRCDEMVTDLPGFLCVPLRHGRVRGALAVAGRAEAIGAAERDVLVSLARQGAVAIENAVYYEQSVNFFTHASDLMVSFLEQMDVHLPGHSRAVAAYSDMLTRRLGLPDAERRSVHFAALLHDIGKVSIDRAILRDPGPLSDEARAVLQQHPANGLEIVRPISLWEDVLPMIHAHHERWDGSGYPMGQVADAIPLGARVIAIADTFDVITRGTPWQSKMEPEEALTLLEASAGSQLDPRLVRLFAAEYREHGADLRI